MYAPLAAIGYDETYTHFASTHVSLLRKTYKYTPHIYVRRNRLKILSGGNFCMEHVSVQYKNSRSHEQQVHETILHTFRRIYTFKCIYIVQTEM